MGQYARFEEFGQDRLASAEDITLGPNPNFNFNNTITVGSRMNEEDPFGGQPGITDEYNPPF